MSQGGVFPLSTTFTPTDTTDYNTATATVQLMVSMIPGPGMISTVAGNGSFGTAGASGAGMLATNIGLAGIYGIAVDAYDNVYLSYESYILKVSASTSIISVVAGNGTENCSGDGGPALSAEVGFPADVRLDAAGNIYFIDYWCNVIRKVTPAGIISVVAGSYTSQQGSQGDGFSATGPYVEISPVSLAVDSTGDLYFSDMSNYVRMVTASTGIISAVAGNGIPFFSGDGGAATSAGLDGPGALAVDQNGNVYIADDRRIRVVSASTGIISTVAGNGTYGSFGDGGLAVNAALQSPTAVAVDTVGNLYIADGLCSSVRVVTASTGIISTVAGDCASGYNGDNIPATSAELNIPNDLAVDS
jgi:hypothetical protein